MDEWNNTVDAVSANPEMQNRTMVLRTEGLVKRYGKRTVVNNVSIDVKQGEIVGLLGPNGAGKTTTIKAVVGIHDFEDGSIIINGHSIKEEPVICKKMMAYIPDNPDLYEHMTGLQYINFIADLFEIPTKIRRERIQNYGDLFDMTEHLSGIISFVSAMIFGFFTSPVLFFQGTHRGVLFQLHFGKRVQ